MIKDNKLLSKIPKVITVNSEDSWCNVYALNYVDEDVCYYVNEDNEDGLYIDTTEMALSKIDEVGEYELAENFLYIDPVWDKGMFSEICDRFKENKPYFFITDKMKSGIESYLKEDLEI